METWNDDNDDAWSWQWGGGKVDEIACQTSIKFNNLIFFFEFKS